MSSVRLSVSPSLPSFLPAANGGRAGSLARKSMQIFFGLGGEPEPPRGGGECPKRGPTLLYPPPALGVGGARHCPRAPRVGSRPPPPSPGVLGACAPGRTPPHPPQAGPVGVFTSHSARPGLHRLGKGTRGFLGSDGGRGVSVSCVGVCVPSPPPTPTQPKASTAPLGIHHRKRGARAVGIYLLPPLAPCILPPVAEGN